MSKIDHTDVLGLRRCILSQLYELFREVPLAPVELRQLAENCNAEAKDLNWNMIYLEKKGWVQLSHDINCPPYAACYAEITGSGIDLVENQNAFEKLFSMDEPTADEGRRWKDEG